MFASWQHCQLQDQLIYSVLSFKAFLVTDGQPSFIHGAQLGDGCVALFVCLFAFLGHPHSPGKGRSAVGRLGVGAAAAAQAGLLR